MGEVDTVPPFIRLLGYRGEQVWTVSKEGVGTPDAGVRVRRGAEAAPRTVRMIDLSRRSADSRVPVALLDDRVFPGPVARADTGVLFADSGDPSLPRAGGYELHVEWPGRRGTGFHVDRVLAYGRDAIVALDLRLVVIQVNQRGEAVRTAVTLPEGWTLPGPPRAGRFAFADGGFAMVVRTADGEQTALAYADLYTGRSVLVPGSEGASSADPRGVVGRGARVLFLVGGEGQAGSGIAVWDTVDRSRAHLLTRSRVPEAAHLVCAVPR
jgi:hypothetical protein